MTVDVGICHLYLTDADIGEYDTDRYLLPPLRGADDREALLRGLRDGSIDAVCSDHHPHDEDAKAAPFSLAEPGASTIEFLLPLLHSLAKTRGLDPLQMLRPVTCGPAAAFGLEGGTLAPGRPADIALFDPDRTWTIDKNRMTSAGRNTPFHGRELAGRVCLTLLGGKVVFAEDGQ